MKLKNVVCLALLFAMMFCLSACTDYEGVVDDKYEEWMASIKYGSLTDSRDGQVYKTITIGSQIWMAENLNYETGNSWCYENKASNCDKYGRLYTWSAVMDSAAQFSVNAGTRCGDGKTCTPNSPHRGICPEGWHVPTNEEYSTLYTYIGGSSTAGSLLKSTSGWYDSGNGSDEYGFSVLPAGGWGAGGLFGSEGDGAYLWSASESGCSYAWYQNFYYSYDDAYQDSYGKYEGQSLRCLKDSSPTSGAATSSSSQAQPSSSFSIGSPSSSSVIPSGVEGSCSSSAKSSSSVASSSSIIYGSLTDSRDNQVYKTVTIGTQTWMAENLNYAYTGVKYNYDSYTSDSTSWCYENKASNCDKYGRLYTWSAVMDSAAQFSVNAGTKCGYGKTCTPNSPHRGICPEGWHVPTNEEYSTLYTYIGGSSTAGSLLKSTSGWNDYNGKSGNGTDKYGFSVLPAGGRSNDGNFNDEGDCAGLWSASEYNSRYAWDQYFDYDDGDAGQGDYYKINDRSLRCLKDSSPTSGAATSSSSQVQPLSSSAKSSSSISSSSSVVSSSSVGTSWDYLNPDIDYGEYTDIRDGQVYKTVRIGNQVWFAENLKIGEFVEGSNKQIDDTKIERYCYGDNVANCEKYGGFYKWAEAMSLPSECNAKSCADLVREYHQGICPAGWHVPTNEEYSALYTYIGGSSTAGSLLKSTSGWINGGNGSDKYGFSVLPAGGGRDDNGDFYDEGYDAYLWSASERNSYYAWGQNFVYNYDDAGQAYYGDKSHGRSLRCLQNQ